MSIPVAQALEAEKPLRERIIAFLEAAPSEAFSLPEIYVGVEKLDPAVRQLVTVMWTMAILEGKSPAPKRWIEALEDLLAARQIRKTSVRGTDYYWLSKGQP